ncbi:hypothetical protein HYDPIDRAFT_33279 [Hydnomerulius pinastri MD-312]|uniref:Uncharacterized protein n=1 Tax=Hydnomerulius pinastri MD-312 TaxID=994086 RepID=A0A0C9VNU1_9AGAM|nr:hypothetical protein HYDPIDRAFT_33279 [Hydnomerulius pinastri MD-312]
MAHDWDNPRSTNPVDPPPGCSISPNNVPPQDTVEASDEEQLGGGRRTPSPPPYQTATRLRSTVKATHCDSGLVREAQACRGRLLEHASVPAQPSSEYDENPFLSEPAMRHGSDSTSQTVIHCASQLFGTSQNSNSNSLFPPCEDKAHGAHTSTSSPPVSKGYEISAQPGAQNGTGHNAVRQKPRPPVSMGGESSSQTMLPAYLVPPPPQRLHSAVPARRYVDSGDSVTLDESDSDKHLITSALGVHFSSTNVTHMDVDVPDRPDLPSPPSIRGKSLQSLTSLLSKSSSMKVQVSDQSQPATFTVGRTSTAVAAILDKGFESINGQFSELGNRVGMPTQQVITHFTRQFARTNSPNDWNIYQKYFAANKARELARLPDFENVMVTPLEKMPQCYKLFQQEFSDTWQEILTTFEEAEVLGEVDKTVAQCQQLFHKTAKKLVQSVR